MSRQTSGRAGRTLRANYRKAAQAGDWPLCKTITGHMRGLYGDGSEVRYALGYALEQLGQMEEARKAYDVVLLIDKSHERARARLRGLFGR